MMTNFQNMRDNIQKVPQNLAAGGDAQIIYKTPISDAFGTTTGTVNSAFSPILGSSNTSGIIGTFYSSFASMTDTLDSIKNGSAAFASGAAGFSGSISSLTSDLTKVQDQVNDIDNSLSGALDLL
jgi:hypothetical protein